jgi:hypothetical protein
MHEVFCSFSRNLAVEIPSKPKPSFARKTPGKFIHTGIASL